MSLRTSNRAHLRYARWLDIAKGRRKGSLRQDSSNPDCPNPYLTNYRTRKGLCNGLLLNCVLLHAVANLCETVMISDSPVLLYLQTQKEHPLFLKAFGSWDCVSFPSLPQLLKSRQSCLIHELQFAGLQRSSYSPQANLVNVKEGLNSASFE